MAKRSQCGHSPMAIGIERWVNLSRMLQEGLPQDVIPWHELNLEGQSGEWGQPLELAGCQWVPLKMFTSEGTREPKANEAACWLLCRVGSGRR